MYKLNRIIRYVDFIVESKLHSSTKLDVLATFFNVSIHDNTLTVKGYNIEYFDETGCYHIDGKQFKTPNDVVGYINEN